MYTGQCLCGDVKVSFSAEPLAAALCHCQGCRRISGSAYGLNWVIPATALIVTGTPKLYSTTANTGNSVTGHFCGRCGTTLWRDGPATEGLAYLKAGILDDQAAVDDNKPKAEIFTKRRVAWLDPIEGAHQKLEMLE